MSKWLAVIPFLLLIGLYVGVSEYRHAINPKDKIAPTISQIYEKAYEYAFVESPQLGYRLFNDTQASLQRIVVGVGFSAVMGLFLGVHMGLFRTFDQVVNPFITFLSIVPPLSLLPMILITMGTDEVAKIGLIFIGTVFFITRDVYKETIALPREQIIKAMTLGASKLEIVYKIVIPQIIPTLLTTVRLNLGAAWLFLLASEAVSARVGLGYTIFLVKRYMAMDVIIFYVLWITLVGFLMDYALRKINWKLFPWYIATKES